MCVCVCVKRVPGIGNTLHDGLVSSHGHAGVLGGDDNSGGDGVCRPAHICDAREDGRKGEEASNPGADLQLGLPPPTKTEALSDTPVFTLGAQSISGVLAQVLDAIT